MLPPRLSSVIPAVFQSDGVSSQILGLTSPNLMVGITSWQQQIPLPTSYFAYTTNPEKDTKSIGYGKPNVWRLPLVPTPSDAPSISPGISAATKRS